MCFQLVHAAPQLRVVKALRVKKKKLQTRRPPIPTNPFAHPPSHTPIESPTLTHHPSHPRRATTMQQYVQQHMSWYMQCLSLFRGGISIFLRFSNTPGSEGSVPARAPLHAPARRVGHRRQFLRRGFRELICGGGRGEVVVPRGVEWRSAMAAVFFMCGINNFFKDPFGHHYYHHRGAVYDNDFDVIVSFVRAHFPKALWE